MAIYNEEQDPNIGHQANPYEEIKEAKALLKSHGYHVEGMWTDEDVQMRFECTTKQALKVLAEALGEEGTTEHIRWAIDYYAGEMGLKEIDN